MKLQVKTYYVDQGLCNTVAGYEEEGKILFLGLFDCGSGIPPSRNWDSVSEQTYERIRNLAYSRWENGTNENGEKDRKFFDIICISHQDADHWNLVMNLLKRLRQEIECSYFFNEDSQGQVGMYFPADKEIVYAFLQETDRLVYEIDEEDLCVSYELFSDASYVIREERFLDEEDEYIFEGTYTNETQMMISLRWFEDNLRHKIEGVYIDGNRRVTHITKDESGEIQIVYNWEETGTADFLSGLFRWALQMAQTGLLAEEAMIADVSLLEGFSREEIEENLQECRMLSNGQGKIVGEVCLAGELRGRSYQAFGRKMTDYAEEVKTDGFGAGRTRGILERWGLQHLFTASVDGASQWHAEQFPGRKLLNKLIKNLTSEILELMDVERNEGRVLFPGDATVHTMVQMESQVQNLARRYALMIAPHHGSDITSSDTLTAGGGYQILRRFLRWAKARRIFISAGQNNPYQHPGKNFIVRAMRRTMDAPNHTVYCFEGNESSFFSIEKAVSTTVASENGVSAYYIIILDAPVALHPLRSEAGTEDEIQPDTEETPKSPEETPKSPEETPKSPEETPKSLEETPKSLEETPKSLEETPKSLEETPKSVEKALESAKKIPARELFL